MEPENGPLEDDFPLQPDVVFRCPRCFFFPMCICLPHVFLMKSVIDSLHGGSLGLPRGALRRATGATWSCSRRRKSETVSCRRMQVSWDSWCRRMDSFLLLRIAYVLGALDGLGESFSGSQLQQMGLWGAFGTGMLRGSSW